ncbi:Complement factor H-related protein 4-like 2, partial [Homarus americanus]
MTRTWTGDTAVSTTAQYTCSRGYFVEGTEGNTSQSLMCTGQLGQWLPLLLPCLEFPVCLLKNITVPQHINVTQEAKSQYINGTVNYTCPELMTTMAGDTVQTLTCLYTRRRYAFVPGVVSPCDVCSEEPMAENAVADWKPSITWTVHMTVMFTCTAGYSTGVNTNTGVFTCTNTGWTTPDACYEGCAGEPIVANASTAWSNTVIWKEGMTLVFTCVDGYITDPDNTTGVLTCNTTGWTTRDECYEACAQEPTIANATTVWVNTETWTEGMTVLFTCIESFLTDAGSNTGVINCSLTGWRTDDVCYK